MIAPAGITGLVEFTGVANSDDRQLAARLARGDESALAEVYDLHAGIAYGLALKILSDPGRAEDAVQDAFLKLWQSAGSFDNGRGSLRGWLLTIVRNRAIDLLRGREGHHRQAQELPEALPADLETTDPFRQVSQRIEGEEVRQALHNLTPEQRQVVELAYWGGYSQREIAEMIRIPIGTVKGRMRLALEKLSSYMEVRGLLDG